MNESEKMTLDILKDIEDMELKKIEKLRKQLLDYIKAENIDKFKRVEWFVNLLCDIAIKRAKHKEMVS